MRPLHMEVKGNNIEIVVLFPPLRWRWVNEGGVHDDNHNLPPGLCLGRSHSHFVIVAPSDDGAAIVFVFVFILAIRMAAVIIA